MAIGKKAHTQGLFAQLNAPGYTANYSRLTLEEIEHAIADVYQSASERRRNAILWMYPLTPDESFKIDELNKLRWLIEATLDPIKEKPSYIRWK